MNQEQQLDNLKKPLEKQFVRMVVVYKAGSPMSNAYQIVIETLRKKPESRQEQVDICQVDANHLANGLLHYARMIQDIWFKDYGLSADQMIDSICNYLQKPAEPIENSASVALTLEFDPAKKNKERYSIERESTDNRELGQEEQFEAMKLDMKHFANGVRFMANLMEKEFGKDFNLKEDEILGGLCYFLKTTIRGNKEELNVIGEHK